MPGVVVALGLRRGAAVAGEEAPQARDLVAVRVLGAVTRRRLAVLLPGLLEGRVRLLAVLHLLHERGVVVPRRDPLGRRTGRGARRPRPPPLPAGGGGRKNWK